MAEPSTGTLIIGLYVFVLSVFAGLELISKVPHTLHTPLMSGINAISGVILLAALMSVDYDLPFANYLGFAAVALGMTNVVGGFVVTDRMLKMFRK